MELVEGPSLGDRMVAGPLDPALLASLQQHLAEGLDKAHRAGVIHRHLAPDKIVLPDGRVDRAKIIDFGVAGGAQLGGRYDFASPEQLGLFGGEVTSRSDIYSLGLVLAACALGRALDMGGSEAEAVGKRRSVPDLAGIDPPLRDLLEAMLQPDPRDRPKSMAEVAHWPTFEKPGPDARKTRLYTSAPKSTARPPSGSATAGSPREDAQAKTRLVVMALAATAILLAAVYLVYW
jgi:serine/threonine-protein kinase